MKKSTLNLIRLVPAACALAVISPMALAGTIVHLGTIDPITSASDLDLQGNIVHAINFRGTEVISINGVDFVPDDAVPAGTTLLGPNFASPWETRPELGNTPDDNALETMLHTMRWAVQGERLAASFAVKAGHRYKVQVIFYENRDFARSWDIAVDGTLAVEEITSLGVDTATYSATEARMYVFELDAEQASLSIEMGQLNGTMDGEDLGSLWQGLTLEDLGPGRDGDGDGMPDAFEAAFSLNTGVDDSGDDGDGDDSTNLAEFQNGTDPTDADSDDDGIADGAETNTGVWVSATNRGTDPMRADSDGDTIPDAAETNSGTFTDLENTGTDPNKSDSDGDGFHDGLELVLGSNPASGASIPAAPTQVKLLANWNFDSADGDAVEVLDGVRSLKATLENGASLSPLGGGKSGGAQDRSVRFGLRGGALVEVADAAFLNLPAKADAASISLWQKSVTISNTTTFWGSIDSAELRGASAHLPWSDRSLYFDTAGCCDPDLQRTSVPVGVSDESLLQWHHYVLVKSGSTKQIWLDGQLLVEATNSANWPDSFFRMFIGAGPSGSRGIEGEIDDFAVFHGALIPAQIIALNAGIAPALVENVEDVDGDSLPDAWETENNLNTALNDADGDPDNDRSTNLNEFLRSTNPQKADTDDDGYEDGAETDTGVFVNADDTGTDPLVPDTDGDGVEDGKETGTGVFVDTDDRGTSPLKKDSEGDGLSDGVETGTGIYVNESDTGTDPNKSDTDGDGLDDGVETGTGIFVDNTNTGSDPNNSDSDGDSIPDGEEVAAGTNPNIGTGEPEPSPPAIASIDYNIDNSEVTLTWTSKPGSLYTLESSVTLLSWSDFRKDIPSAGATTSLTIGAGELGAAPRYVRIREQ
ncbi:MAG: LamG-like jellyroll fold domain-containing protein [Verrucomicrobiales bacterium]